MNEMAVLVSEPLTRNRLAEKVAWEGGAFDALRYGIRSNEIADSDLAELWREMETLYEKISPIAWRIESLLQKAR